MVLCPSLAGVSSTFLLDGNPILRAQQAEYVGGTTFIEGVLASKTISRIQPASARLKPLKLVGLHGRGLAAPGWLRLYKSLVRPVYEYMIYLLGKDTELQDAVDAQENDLFFALFGN